MFYVFSNMKYYNLLALARSTSTIRSSTSPCKRALTFSKALHLDNAASTCSSASDNLAANLRLASSSSSVRAKPEIN
jgi:hypothetical protein